MSDIRVSRKVTLSDGQHPVAFSPDRPVTPAQLKQHGKRLVEIGAIPQSALGAAASETKDEATHGASDANDKQRKVFNLNSKRKE